MNGMFKSATFKLTLNYLAIVVVISLLFSGVVYYVGTNNLAFGLHQQTQRITNNFPVFHNSPFLRPDSDDLQSSAHRLLAWLAMFNLLVLIVAALASYALARRTLRPIEEAHEQQKRFTADASHELRTPLTALKMESEVALLDATASKSELRRVLRSNVEEATKLDTLINNLLRLSRLEAGELRQNFAPLTVAPLISEAIDHVRKAADARSITIVQETAAEGTVDGDHDSLVQLLVILLDNAIKYSSSGTTVMVSSSISRDHVTIAVADQGSGIPRKSLEHVFERFYRGDHARSGNQGFGLGLSIAKLIADIHGATISLRSRVKYGTTATVQLSLAAALDATAAERQHGRQAKNHQ